MKSIYSLAALTFSFTALVGCSRTDTLEPKFAEGTSAATSAGSTTAKAEKASPLPTSSFSAGSPARMDNEEELQGGSRPRLSRTLRLGVDTSTYESMPHAQGPQAGSGVTVIVNNNISQQQTAVSGGYGGYGYRGYSGNNGSAGGYNGSRNFTTSPTASPLPQPQGRGAAPRVGGDWSPPPNYGPPAMR